MEILKEEGCGFDCSSYTELMLSDKVGAKQHDIMFSSNATPDEDFKLAYKLGAIINLDDFTHIDVLDKLTGIPETICCRYNPGGEFKTSEKGNVMDTPKDAKYGMTHEQIIEAYKILKERAQSVSVCTHSLQATLSPTSITPYSPPFCSERLLR